MTKRRIEDMVKPKRQKKEIIIKELKEKKKPIERIERNDRMERMEREEVHYAERENDFVITPVKVKKRSRYMLWFVALVSIVFCFFAVSFLFSKAEITVNPKIKDITLNENLSASKDSNTDALFFNLLKISGEENRAVLVTGEKDVLVKAEGVVRIYNAFNTSPLTLNKDTKLEGSNKKIYKTQSKVIIPGKTKSGTPGSVEVKIYGAEAGSDYNSAPLDFKILSFKGTSKYTKVYGRSKGDIAGGFKGKAPDISEADKTNAINDLKTDLEAKLLKKATNQIPSGFILFKDAVFLSLDDANVPFDAKDGNLTITLKGTLYGLLFNEKKLTKKIVEKNIEKYDGSDVYISNIKNLIFSLENKESVALGDVKDINFNLSGPAKIVYRLDENKFIGDLLGKSKKDFNQVLSQYPNIDSATLVLDPIWRMSIPDKSKNIKIIVNYPK